MKMTHVFELVAEFCVLQEELYQEALKKHKEEAN